MEINVTVDIKDLTKNLKRIERRQIPFATSVALNNTAFKVRKAEQIQLPKKLDRPTKQTVNAVTVTKSKNWPIRSSVVSLSILVTKLSPISVFSYMLM